MLFHVRMDVAIPRDLDPDERTELVTTEKARALQLLEKNGFFTLKEGAGITATKNDIAENPHNIVIDEVEAAQIPNVLQDEDYAVINSNYAIPAGLNPVRDAIALERPESPYANVIAVRRGEEGAAWLRRLVAAYHTEEIRAFVRDSFGGAVVPAF